MEIKIICNCPKCDGYGFVTDRHPNDPSSKDIVCHECEGDGKKRLACLHAGAPYLLCEHELSQGPCHQGYDKYAYDFRYLVLCLRVAPLERKPRGDKLSPLGARCF